MTLPPELQQRFNHINDRIFFDFAGNHYSIPLSAYPKADYIYIPNEDVYLKVSAWVEATPPILEYGGVMWSAGKPDGVVCRAEVDYTDHLG